MQKYTFNGKMFHFIRSCHRIIKKRNRNGVALQFVYYRNYDKNATIFSMPFSLDSLTCWSERDSGWCLIHTHTHTNTCVTLAKKVGNRTAILLCHRNYLPLGAYTLVFILEFRLPLFVDRLK